MDDQQSHAGNAGTGKGQHRRPRLGLRAGAVAALLLGAGAAWAEPLPRLAGIEVAGWAHAAAGRTGPVVGAADGAAELTAEGRVVRPLTVETPVRIASISKLALALAIHRLADRGLIGLDDDISRHLGWTLRNPAHPAVPISIRQVLRHHSGLSDAGGYGGMLGEQLRETIGAKSWGPAAPGTAFDYANIGSAVLAEVVERATGERFDRAMRTLVFEPLGVRGCFNWSSCPEGHAAAGAVLYRKSADYGVTWVPAGPWIAQVDAERPPGGCPVRRKEGAPCDLEGYRPGTNGGLFGPQGGLRISVAELARLGQALLENRGGFLKPESHAALFRSAPVAAGGAGEETDTRLMQAWSDGGLHCFSGKGAAGGDQPLAPRPMGGCGHLGEAYGLYSGVVMDPAAGTVHAWALTGSADRPPAGRVSRFNALVEELVGRALGSR